MCNSSSPPQEVCSSMRRANGDEFPFPSLEQVKPPSTGSKNAVKLVFMIPPKIWHPYIRNLFPSGEISSDLYR